MRWCHGKQIFRQSNKFASHLRLPTIQDMVIAHDLAMWKLWFVKICLDLIISSCITTMYFWNKAIASSTYTLNLLLYLKFNLQFFSRSYHSFFFTVEILILWWFTGRISAVCIIQSFFRENSLIFISFRNELGSRPWTCLKIAMIKWAAHANHPFFLFLFNPHLLTFKFFLIKWPCKLSFAFLKYLLLPFLWILCFFWLWLSSFWNLWLLYFFS